MLEKILRKVLPFHIVRRDDYMVRFFLWGSRGVIDSNEERYGGKSLRLHHIISSDDDNLFHCHPYDFSSLILWGGYIEHQPNKPSKKYHIFQINRKGLDDFHKLELNKPAWTLVYCRERKQTWGFWSGKITDPFIPWNEHKR